MVADPPLPPGRVRTAHGTAELLADADRDGAWVLLVDDTPQSHVDLEDPTHLEFEYVRRMGHALDLAAPPGEPGRPADAELTGTAELLLRRLWGRPADVTVTGDPAAEALLRGR